MLRTSPDKARERAAFTGSPGAAGASAANRRARRGIRRSLVAVVVALGLAGTGAAAAGASTVTAAAGVGHCTRTVTGAHHGALVAGRGVLCLDRATQVGPVHVWPGAGLKVSASVISGAVTATRARSVRLCGSMIIGALRAGATTGPVTAGAGASCRGDTVHGRLVITGSAGRVRMAGLRQQGPVTLSGNAGGVMVSGGSVGGTVTVRGNRGRAPVVISANAVSGSLACAANRPAPGDRHRPNTVSGTAGGQCAGLVPPQRRQALPPLAQDLSSTLPNLNYEEAVGDFTGAGHDQRAYAQDGQLKIADVSKFGGQVVRSTPTDLMATPNNGCNGAPYTGVWDDREGSYTVNGATYGLTGVKVAASASNIYMAGASWSDGACDNYLVHLYELPHDGSCATASCAQHIAVLPDHLGYETRQLVVVTSLATGVVGGQTLIAVGLSDFGIYIFNDQLNLVTRIQDMGVGGGWPEEIQTPVTAIAFGPPTAAGQGGVLAVGTESPGPVNVFGYHLNPDGTEASMWSGGGAGVTMSAAVAQVNGQQMAVFGSWDPGGGFVVVNAYPMSGTGTPALGWKWADPQPLAMPSGITPLTPWNGDPGNQDLVVGSYDGTGDRVLQDQNGTAAYVPIGPGGATTGTADQVYEWWPGYGLGLLQVVNTSAGPVNIAMASRPDPGYGCWLDVGLDRPPVPAFPAADTRVDAGTTSAAYLVAALTAGPDGSCASAQPGSTGERATYVIITPAGDSADEHIVKLTSGADRTLRIDSQVGGYLTASLSQVSSAPGSWGTWQLAVSGGSAPKPAGVAVVTGYRLTAAPDPVNYKPPTGPAADDPCRPVYRFDVTGAHWKNVVTAGQQTARIPAMTAQGSSDGGKTWADLGQLMPATAPTVGADGTVTLGPASFFFQNAPGTATPPGVWTSGDPSRCPATGQAPVTEVRVVSDGQASAVVNLADPTTAPPPPPLNGGTGATPVGSIAVVPDGGGGAAAVLRADGVDLAGLTLQLKPSGGGAVLASDPRYHLFYYRDDATQALVTGLYQPGDYGGYTGIGRYAADGSAGQPTRNYLATTSTATENLDPMMNDTGTVTAYPGSPFAVSASSNPLTPAGASMTGGISITGCTASATATCTLAVPAGTAPALYQAGGPDSGPVTGLQLGATAITGRASLPLQTGTANAHNLGSAPLVVTASQAKLTDTSQFFPSDTADTALVTAGQLVPVLSTRVGP